MKFKYLIFVFFNIYSSFVYAQKIVEPTTFSKQEVIINTSQKDSKDLEFSYGELYTDMKDSTQIIALYDIELLLINGRELTNDEKKSCKEWNILYKKIIISIPPKSILTFNKKLVCTNKGSAAPNVNHIIKSNINLERDEKLSKDIEKTLLRLNIWNWVEDNNGYISGLISKSSPPNMQDFDIAIKQNVLDIITNFFKCEEDSINITTHLPSHEEVLKSIENGVLDLHKANLATEKIEFRIKSKNGTYGRTYCIKNIFISISNNFVITVNGKLWTADKHTIKLIKESFE